MNHMKERHLDGTVLMRHSTGGIFEPLARPDLLITDTDRADVISSRRKDRDAALIGKASHYFSSQTTPSYIPRYYHCNALFQVVSTPPVRL